MSVTAQDIFYDARALLDEYTDDGILLPDADVADLEAKAIRFIDSGQKQLAPDSKLFKTFSYTHKHAPNLLGDGSNFSLIDYEGMDQYYPNVNGVVGAKAYYFEVDGEADVYIEELELGVWTPLATHEIAATVTEPTPYSGAISVTSTNNPVRMRFTGDTHYRHRNRALYSYPYSSDRVPQYAPYVKVEMPSDFMSVSQIIQETAEGNTRLGAYQWQGQDELYVSYWFEGTVKVVYRPVPVTITDITDSLTIEDDLAKTLQYFVAAKLAPFEMPDLVSYMEQLFNEAVYRATKRNVISPQQIQDVYGGL